jgi:hypothetical protein
VDAFAVEPVEGVAVGAVEAAGGADEAELAAKLGGFEVGESGEEVAGGVGVELAGAGLFEGWVRSLDGGRGGRGRRTR